MLIDVAIFITGSHVIPDCGHWLQQDHPDEVNALLLDFLQGLAR